MGNGHYFATTSEEPAVSRHPQERAFLIGTVDRLVKRYLKDPVFHEVISDTQTVSAMVHHFLNVHQMDRIKVTAAICNAQEKTIIFVRTKRGADKLVD